MLSGRKQRCRLGLDQSLLDQYLNYLHGLVQGDLGQGLINQAGQQHHQPDPRPALS